MANIKDSSTIYDEKYALLNLFLATSGLLSFDLYYRNDFFCLTVYQTIK